MDVTQLIKELTAFKSVALRMLNKDVPNPLTDAYVKNETVLARGLYINWNEFKSDVQKFRNELTAAGKTPEQIEEELAPVKVLSNDMLLEIAAAKKAHPAKFEFLKEYVGRGLFLYFGKDYETKQKDGKQLAAFRDNVKGTAGKTAFFDHFANLGQKLADKGATVSTTTPASKKKAKPAAAGTKTVDDDLLELNDAKYEEGKRDAAEDANALVKFITDSKKAWNQKTADVKQYLNEAYDALTGEDLPAQAQTAPGPVKKTASTETPAPTGGIAAVNPDPEMLNLLKDIEHVQREMISLIVTDMHPVPEKSRKANKEAKNTYAIDEVAQAYKVYALWRQYKEREQKFEEQLIARGASRPEIVAALAPLERAQWNLEMDVAQAHAAHPEKIPFIKSYLDQGMTQLTQDKHWNKNPAYVGFYNDVTGRNTNNFGIFDYWVDQGNARLQKGGKIVNPLTGQAVGASNGAAGVGSQGTGASNGSAGVGAGAPPAGAGPKDEGDWWSKTKEWFSELPGAKMAGGAVGGILGYMGGKIFGDGPIGTVFSVVFALVGAIFGSKFAGDRWGGGATNPAVSGQNQPGYGQGNGQGGHSFPHYQNNGQGPSRQQQYDAFPPVPGFGWPQPYPQFGCFPNMQYAVTQYHQNSMCGPIYDARDQCFGTNFGSPNVNHQGHSHGGQSRGSQRNPR